MSLSDQALSALQELMTQNKELLAQVQATNDAAQAANIIAAAAAQNGIEATQADITQHFEEAFKATTNQALSDKQLDAVAGGSVDDDWMIALSILGLGIGCGIISIAQAAGAKFSLEGRPAKKFC
ncbi:MAG: hypothetical protein FD135_2054 [Comamonadaceae bacterium]|nr:MAG: hypothetical protein FD135_2054 [Comamonadaceae bacterium]